MTSQKPNINTPTRRRFIAGATAVATAGVIGATATTPAAASSPNGILADGFESGDPSHFAFARGFVSAYSSSVLWPSHDLDDYVDRAVNEFRANEAAWIDYGDWLASEHDFEPAGETVVAVDWRFTRGRWPTLDDHVETVVEAEYDSSAERFDRVRWEIDTADDADYSITLQNRAVEHAADELSQFRREWIGDPHDDEPNHALPSDEYVSEMAGRYLSSVRFGDDGEHVLEILLGEFDG